MKNIEFHTLTSSFNCLDICTFQVIPAVMLITIQAVTKSFCLLKKRLFNSQLDNREHHKKENLDTDTEMTVAIKIISAEMNYVDEIY